MTADPAAARHPSPSAPRAAAVTRRGTLPNPCFLPDGTRAVVKGTDSADLESVGVAALMVNAFHLSQRPGVSVVNSLGGVHGFMGWQRPLWTDSGGFQLYSLIRENPDNGQITDKGFTFLPPDSRAKELFTPVKAITNQWRLGADVLFCLDQCTHPSDPRAVQEDSVARTLAWSRACKLEFDKRLASSRAAQDQRPLLFGVVQGGTDPDLRRRCAETLLEIGFDGFGFGGWPIDEEGGLVDMVYRVAELVPREFPLHGLGIGKPENLVAAWRAGYSSFDCVLPTRDARRRRLLVAVDLDRPTDGKEFYRYLYITDDRFRRDSRPVDETCPCPLCQRYSRGYLHHLFRIGDSSAERLATLHNLAFMTRLMEMLAAQGSPEEAHGAPG